MRKAIRILLLFVALLVGVVGPVAPVGRVGALSRVAAQTPDGLLQFQKLAEAYRYLMALYVDDTTPGPLVERAIEAMLGELDPHSAYISAQEMREVQAGVEGEFSGIGIEYNVLRDTVVVLNTVSGGPAERAGVRANDRIVRIDTLDAVGLGRAEVPALLRGEAGTRVMIEIVRPTTGERLRFGLKRARIPLHTLDAAYLAADGIGYLRLNRFGRTTMEEFTTAYRRLGPLRGVILDLRGNGGGLLDQAVELAGFFLPRGAVIVSTEGRAVPLRRFETSSDGEGLGVHLAVLIDEASASGSEIVAGAIQDWDRGVVLGRPSFGKGLVQRQIALADGSALRLTVARYHTPSGRVIQRPYELGDRRGYYLDHLRRYADERDSTALPHSTEANGLRDSSDSTDLRRSPDSADSTQLSASTLASADSAGGRQPLYRTLRSGRAVYGGGGIRPDVVVAPDTAGLSAYYGALLREGALQEFANEWLDGGRDSLAARYPTFEAFDAGFTASDALLEALVAFGERRGVARDAAGLAHSGETLRTHLKALAARRLYGPEAFYRVVNPVWSGAYVRAMAMLEAWDRLAEPLLAPSERGVNKEL